MSFLNDFLQAEEASSQTIRNIGMTGRQLFEITTGATLILNPNRRYCLFYPEEFALVLQGKALSPVTTIDGDYECHSPLEPEAQPPKWLIAPLVNLFGSIPGVESATVGRCLSSDSDPNVRLVLIVFWSRIDAERAARAATVVLETVCERMEVGLDVLTICPSVEHRYGRFPEVFVRTSQSVPPSLRDLH